MTWKETGTRGCKGQVMEALSTKVMDSKLSREESEDVRDEHQSVDGGSIKTHRLLDRGPFIDARGFLEGGERRTFWKRQRRVRKISTPPPNLATWKRNDA